MKHVWSGTISFGLVSIPVALGTVVSEDKLPVHFVRKSDGSRITMRRFAAADGAEVPYGDLVKGYELANGQLVLLDDADFEKAYGEKNRKAEILSFVPRDSVPRAAHDTSYYVEPEPNGAHAYALLAEAMNVTGKDAVVSVAVRQREATALLHATADGYLVLERLQWAAQVKKPDFTAPELTSYAPAEIDMAENLVASMSGESGWASLTDTSRERLEAVVQAKDAAGQVTGAPAGKSTPATPPVDIMAALQASVEAHRKPSPQRKPRAPRAPRAKAA